MELNSFDQLTPEFLREYRDSKRLRLIDFWGAIGCTTSRGFSYETGKTEIPEVVKRLVFLHYGVGIPTDCQSEEFLKFRDTLRSINAVKVAKAAELIQQAQALLLGEAEGESGELD